MDHCRITAMAVAALVVALMVSLVMQGSSEGTGVHSHFEVRVNGTAGDPPCYL